MVAPTALALSAVEGVEAGIVNCVPLIVNVPATKATSKPAWSSGSAALTAWPIEEPLATFVGVASADTLIVNEPIAAEEEAVAITAFACSTVVVTLVPRAPTIAGSLSAATLVSRVVRLELMLPIASCCCCSTSERLSASRIGSRASAVSWSTIRLASRPEASPPKVIEPVVMAPRSPGGERAQQPCGYGALLKISPRSASPPAARSAPKAPAAARA